jgi:hypothetical protein
MITRNARKKLSPRSSAQKGNSGFSVCLRIVLFFPFFFADAYIKPLSNTVVLRLEWLSLLVALSDTHSVAL